MAVWTGVRETRRPRRLTAASGVAGEAAKAMPPDEPHDRIVRLHPADLPLFEDAQRPPPDANRVASPGAPVLRPPS